MKKMTANDCPSIVQFGYGLSGIKNILYNSITFCILEESTVYYKYHLSIVYNVSVEHK